tara:strand:+ start:45 stop:731 length:687 start_codon:yes stop_codon:yes gene_type:complete
MFGIYCPVDDGYFLHFQGLLYSFSGYLDVPHEIIVYDMGLSDKYINIINTQFSYLKCKIVKTNTSRNDKLTYKFKINIIEMMKKDNYEFAIMLDAKDHLKTYLSVIQEEAKKSKVLIQYAGGCVEEDWTHNTCLEHMGVANNEKIKKSFQFQSNNVVFHIPQAIDIMNTIILYGNNMNCLCPAGSEKSFEGTSRHRQDQSVISISCKLHNIEHSSLFYSTYHNTIVNK